MPFRPYSKYYSLEKRRKKELLVDKIIITFWRLIIIFIVCYVAYKMYNNVRQEFISNRAGSQGTCALQTQKGD